METNGQANGPKSKKEKNGDTKDNLWSAILEEVQNQGNTKLPSNKNVLVLGNNETGKTTLIAKLQGVEDPKKGSALEYAYIDVRDEYRDEMSVVKKFPVEKEYEKNPDISPEDIQKLREWVKTQPHLPGEYLDELDLIVTYHCCEKSAEVSKQVLDLHFTLRTLFSLYFKDRCYDKKIEFTLNTVLIAPLPTPAVKGYRAIYARLLDADPRHFNFVDVVRAFMMVFDLWQYEEGTWPGFVLIIDMDTAVVTHLAKIDLMVLRQVLYFLQEAMLIKLKGVHFMSAPSFMDKLLLMLRPFLKKELLDMLYVHQRDSSSTYDHIPKKALPKECGGEYKDFETIKEEMIVRLQSNPIFFRDENRRRVNEALRKGKKTTVEDLFGIQGSFKKLDID